MTREHLACFYIQRALVLFWFMLQTHLAIMQMFIITTCPVIPEESLNAPLLTFPVSFHSPPADPSDQLRLHGAGAERRPAVRLLLSGGPSGQLPGSGHGGHRQDHGLELRLHGGVGGQLWREGRGCLHAALQRGR